MVRRDNEVSAICTQIANFYRKPYTWTRGAAARDVIGTSVTIPYGTCFCSMGVIGKFAPGRDIEVREVLREVVFGPDSNQLEVGGLVGWNDSQSTDSMPEFTPVAVIEAFRKAAELTKELV